MSRADLIARFTRLYPFLSGCTFPNYRFFLRLYGEHPTARWTRVAGGEVYARLDDYVGRCAFFVGDIDRKISAIFDRVVQPGDTVIDGGANVGVTTLRLARLVGPAGSIHAFEPNPELVRILTETITRNALESIVLHPVALAEKPGRLVLSVPKGNAGMGSIVGGRNDSCVAVHDIEAAALDSLADRISRVRLIKLDVEGAEVAALKGAEGLIARDRPVIIFELNDLHARHAQAAEIAALLEPQGYSFFGVRHSLVRLHLERTELRENVTAHDFVAIARSPDYNDLCRRLNAHGSSQ